MKKNEHISAEVERFHVISGELGQSVIVVEYLQIIGAHGGLTAVHTVHTAVARVDTKEAQVHETAEEEDGTETELDVYRDTPRRTDTDTKRYIAELAEEEDGEHQTNMPSCGSRQSSSTADKHR